MIFAERFIRLLSAAVTLASLICGAPSAWAQEAKIRIAVVDFDTEAIAQNWRYGWSYNNLARAASDNLASSLVKAGRFRVIERQQLDKVLGEQNLAEGGRIDPTTAAKIGKVLGVQLIVVGSVTEFGISEFGGKVPQLGKWGNLGGVGGKVITGKAALTARLVDTTTAEILGAYDGAGSHKFGQAEFAGANLGTTWNSGMASKVLADAVEKLAKDIAGGAAHVTPSTVRGGLEGKVAKVDGDKIYLNLGAASGVKVGDRFEVRRVGEPIKDPDTGETLGGEEEVVGQIEVAKIVGEKLSIARPLQGSTFKTGDRIVMK